MPQVFKSRINNLRAANKSKREHFTQETGLKALDDHISDLNNKVSALKDAKEAFKEYTDKYGLNEEPDGLFVMPKNTAKLALITKINIISDFINGILVSDYSITPVDKPYVDVPNTQVPQLDDSELLDHVNTIITKAQKILYVLNPALKFQEQWGSVVGSEGIKTCEQLNNARKQIFGLSSVNCESFQQAPKEFPNSKKKDEDFTQDFEDLMSQLETTIGSLIQATGSQGSYVRDRNMDLDSLGTKIGEEIEGDTEFIGSMSDSIKAAGTVISDRIGQLERLKTDFDKIRGSNVWKNNLKI